MKESQVRARILEAASRLFYEQGYNLTGINQIIEEAKIARGSLYNHFESKTDLLLIYLSEAEEKWFLEMDDFVSKFVTPQERLLAIFEFKITRQLQSGFGGCRFIKISYEVSQEEHRVFEAVGHQKNRFKNYIKQLVDKIEKETENKLSPDMMTETIFLLLEGATTSSVIYKDPNAMKKAKEITSTLLS